MTKSKLKILIFDNILFGSKSLVNILIYDILYKTLLGGKPLRIMFEKVNGFIRDYDGTKYLVLFDSEKYDAIYDRIRYLKTSKAILHMFFLIIRQKSK